MIERGQHAKALLENETFNWVLNDQTSLHLSALVAARPGPAGADAVAYHHLMQHAYTEIVSTLQGYIAAGEAMEQALTVIDDDEEAGDDADNEDNLND